MRRQFCIVSVLIISVSLVWNNSVSGAVAAWDMDDPTAATQSGWTGVTNPSTSTSAALTVTENGISLTRGTEYKVSRDRGVTDLIETEPLQDMLRDFITAPSSGFDRLSFDFSGLQAQTMYLIRAYSFDARGGFDQKQVEWQDGLGNSLGTCTIQNNNPSSSYLDMTLTSSANGEISISAKGVNTNVFVNGIEIVPEPTTLLIMTTGCLGLLKLRRKYKLPAYAGPYLAEPSC